MFVKEMGLEPEPYFGFMAPWSRSRKKSLNITVPKLFRKLHVILILKVVPKAGSDMYLCTRDTY
jgi:hypothetical protein